MKPTAPLALAICLSLPLAALPQQAAPQQPAAPGQTPTRFTDPANLAGERVSPRNGHELPIDGGNNHPALGLAQLLRRLSTRASILNIVAHPDDEDGGMLTLYSRGLGARVADLSLTRGEGGQNFVTGDFEDALGLIRTQELLANDRYTGVSQMFGTEVDFGFSKTREEAFQKWTHDRVLYDAVRAIRIFRPLVITATFIGNVTDGHGQHQVSGEIAQEAFKAAADPNVFPDMIREGILPWQALKVYARVPFATIDSKGVYDYATNEFVPARFTNYVTGRVTTTKPPADVTVPEGATDPLLTAVAASCENSVPSTEATHNPVTSTEASHNSVPSAKATHNPVISTEAQRSGETCSLNLPPATQLSYLQFARIGLSLQRTQISRNMTLPTSGAHNSGYTLYGSVLCNAPATARDPNITYGPSNTAALNNASLSGTAPETDSAIPSEAHTGKNSAIPSEARTGKISVILSEAKDPCSLPAAALPPASSSALSPTPEPAPAARPIPAHGNAVGYNQQEAKRAGSPIYNPAPTTQPHLQTALYEPQNQSRLHQPVILTLSIAKGKDPRMLPAPALPPTTSTSSSALKGWGFSPAVTSTKDNRALAPEGIYPPAQITTTPATYITPEPAPAARPIPAHGEAPSYSTSVAALKGRGFNPAVTSTKGNRALAPEGIRPPVQITATPALYIIGSEAPAARPIPAHGEAVGYTQQESQRAGSPIYILALESQPNFFTGIDTSIESIATLAPSAPPFLPTQLAQLQSQIATATRNFNPATPSTIAPTLAAALQTTNDLINRIDHTSINPLQKSNVLHELRIKRVQLNDALALALGLQLDASAPSPDVTAHSGIPIHIVPKSPTTADVSLQSAELETPEGTAKRGPWDKTFDVENSKTWLVDISAMPTTITQPYFHRDNIEQPVYQLRNPALRNAPQTPAPLTAWATVTYQGAEITLARVVHVGPQPVSIIPPVSIASAPAATVLPTNQTTAQLTATLTTDTHTSANINVQSPQHWTIQAKAAGPNTVDFFLHPTTPPTDPAIFHLTATTPDHHAYTEGWRAVGYPGLILTNYYTPAITRVVPVDLKLPEHDRIAYLPGTGDAVPQALASIGLTPTMITVADLTPSNLSHFDTVVLGVRAYTAHPDLQGAPTAALLNFARNGGNVLVQYQTSDFTSADAPYPLDLGPGEKVVVETDPVELLTPARTTAGVSPTTGITPGASPTSGVAAGFSPRSAGQGEDGALAPASTLLTTPNLISSADFNNWVSERGHGFLSTWDPHYTALTSTHDPGGDGTIPQAPQRGGLITTQIGKGRWTYCAFALYRQLPQAVPGAFRLFVNLITPPAR